MITRESFIKILDTVDEYFNGETQKALCILGIGENKLNVMFDTIISAVDADVDPKHLAMKDENTVDCGSYVCEWLFGVTDFQEKCADAGALYDYIVAKYEDIKEA